jgi:hypothetical protein
VVVGSAQIAKLGEVDVLSSIDTLAPDVSLLLPEEGATSCLSWTSVEPDLDLSSELINPEEVGFPVSVDLGQ